MKLPTFCYQKAFWIMFSILIASSASAIAATNAQIASIDDRVRENEKQLAQNDVPAVKAQIKEGFDKTNSRFDEIEDKQVDIIRNQDVLKAQNDLMLKLLCTQNNNC